MQTAGNGPAVVYLGSTAILRPGGRLPAGLPVTADPAQALANAWRLAARYGTPHVYRLTEERREFIVVAGLESAVLTPDTIAAVGQLHLENVPILSVVTAGLSNLVSNVPAVLVLKPFVADLSDPSRAWLVVAMASTAPDNAAHDAVAVAPPTNVHAA